LLENGGTRKTGLTGDLSQAQYPRVWRRVRGPHFPQKKIEFGIGGDEISHNFVLRGLPVLVLFLVNLLSRSQFPTALTFTISMQILTNYKNYQKVERYVWAQTPPWLRQSACARRFEFWALNWSGSMSLKMKLLTNTTKM